MGLKKDIIGIGRTADVYEYTNDTVLKLFKPEFSNTLAQQEATSHTIVQESGLKVPKLFDIIADKGRTGLIYQKINGESMLAALRKSPQKLTSYAKDMAALHSDIGSCSIGEGLPSYKDSLAAQIDTQNILTNEEKEKVAENISGLKEKRQLCHGDFHPDNILIENNKYWIIDWMTASYGNFYADAMRTHMLLKYGSTPNETMFKIVLRTAGNILRNTYFKELIKLRSIDKDEVFAWELPILTARLVEGVSLEEKTAITKRIRKLITN